MRSIPRSTVRDTWGWLWKDTAGRVLPFVLVSLAYDWWRRRQGGGHAFITRDWLRDALAGVVLGIPMAALAAVFRGWIAPGYRLPTAADQVVQSTFYLAMNAPGEEMFWRATVQDAVELGAGRVPRLARHRGLLAWLVATAGYGLYHRLGNWSWRSIAGVSLAGMAFGGLYHWRRNIVLPTILHGFATAGFLSWGDVYLHRRAVRRLVGQVGKRRAR